jgi:hypothetical protein
MLKEMRFSRIQSGYRPTHFPVCLYHAVFFGLQVIRVRLEEAHHLLGPADLGVL